jgi:hypothetical protein
MFDIGEGNEMASDEWFDAAQKQPADGRKVLALQPRDNEGYTSEAGFHGKPRAWVIAHWEAQYKRWGILRNGSNWHAPALVSWWRELPSLPGDTLIVPPDRD